MIKPILAIIFFSSVISVQADTLSFEWSAYTDSAEGFRLYMDTSATVIQDLIPIGDTGITVPAPTDGECHNFWLRAYKGTVESGNSDVALYCPAVADPPLPTQPPVEIGGFTVTVTVEPVE